MLTENENLNPQEVKTRSEKIILGVGGEILDFLPTLELPEPREENEVIKRALILNAMFQLHLKAPKSYIAHWIDENDLTSDLTSTELTMLESENELDDEDHFNLYFSLEALWAIAWATNLIETLPFNEEVGNELAALSPNLQLNEDGSKYKDTMKLRSIKSIYEMLDLYYRVHWWINNAVIEDESISDIVLDVVKERRRALEWILNFKTTWDELDLSL